jgi:para-aminobenzoate synthetase component 1
MRFRLDSSLANDFGWTTPSTDAQRVLIGTAAGAVVRDLRTGEQLQSWPDPLAGLDWLDVERRRPGRWIGMLGYELGQLLEPAVRHGGAGCVSSHREVPLFAWGWSEAEAPAADLGSDRSRGREPPAENDPIRSGLAIAGALTEQPGLRSNFTRDEYLRGVERCIEYIRAGDVFQINLSQLLSVALTAPGDRSAEAQRAIARQLYDTLRLTTPARFGALIEIDQFAFISNSPELYLRVHPDGRIMTRPIKGTRPRLAGMDRELLASAKDAAELNMIIDLERNDLGRVCDTGTVRLTEAPTIEAHPTVYHGVATIEGRLRGDVGLVEMLRATFPGGSVTGAPKIRAMQIISELERAPRGVYCGAIGHLESDGSIQLNLAIRTLTLDEHGGRLEIPVGGGIVADSDPDAEYEETLVKAGAALHAVSTLRRTSLELARKV